MISIISGTNRNNATSLEVAGYYMGLLQELGQDCRVIDLNQLPRDFAFSALYDEHGNNPEFNRFQEMVDESSKFVFIVPEYNGSFPGVLKTFIDGLKIPGSFKGKKAAIVGLSSGTQGAALAMSHLVDILNYLGAHVLAKRPRLSKLDESFDGREFSDDYYSRILKAQAEELIDF